MYSANYHDLHRKAHYKSEYDNTQNMYGTMDVSVTGFFSAFANLEIFWIDENYNVEGNFINFDAISSDYLPKLQEFTLDNNKFSGTLSLSDGSLFSSTITHFTIHANDFTGTVDFDIFSPLTSLYTFDIGRNSFSGSVDLSTFPVTSSLYKFDVSYNDFNGAFPWSAFTTATNLNELDINNNSFTGDIDWALISDLHVNHGLNIIELRHNDFSGYADFSWIDRSFPDFYLDLDVNIPCMFSLILFLLSFSMLQICT